MRQIILSLILITASTPVAFGADINAGKAKSVTCAACHGPKGISANPMWPNLAGQQAKYIVKQLESFKSGVRKDPSMSPMAKVLSKTDMENLAAYYNSLK